VRRARASLSTRGLGAPVDKAVIALEYPGQTVAQLVKLSLAECEANDKHLPVAKGRKRVILEFDNSVVMKQLKALDSTVARSALVIDLNVVSVKSEFDVLGFRRLPALQSQVTLGVELSIREPD
jgi:hypothetical protein